MNLNLKLNNTNLKKRSPQEWKHPQSNPSNCRASRKVFPSESKTIQLIMWQFKMISLPFRKTEVQRFNQRKPKSINIINNNLIRT